MCSSAIKWAPFFSIFFHFLFLWVERTRRGDASVCGTGGERCATKREELSYMRVSRKRKWGNSPSCSVFLKSEDDPRGKAIYFLSETDLWDVSDAREVSASASARSAFRIFS